MELWSICLAIFAGMSAIPFELLDQPAGPSIELVSGNRAEVVRFILELLASTSSGETAERQDGSGGRLGHRPDGGQRCDALVPGHLLADDIQHDGQR